MCGLEVIGPSSIVRVIRHPEALVRMFPTFNLSCERTELDLVQNGGNLDQNEIQYDSFSRFYLHVLVVMSKMSTDIIP